MEVFEINVVVRKDRALVGDCVCQDIRIVNAQATPTRLLHRKDVVPETAQLLDNW